MGSFTQRLGRVVEEVGVGALARAANPPPDLVQLAQSKTLRAINDEGVCIWDVDAGLDDCG